MGAQGEVEGRSGVRLYALLAVVGLLILVMVFAFSLFSGQREFASKRVQMIPGRGIVEPGTGGIGYGGARMAGVAPPVSPAEAEAAGFEPRRVSSRLAAPMLIRTASLYLRVDDVRKAHDEVTRIAREANGYVGSTTLSAEAGPMSASITIRVPAEGLDSVIDRIAGLGKLLRKEINTQEVTEEYVDLSSRRRNLMREEERLLDLLKRAGKVSDLLEVEQTLARVRGEIEGIVGRMRYLEHHVALSTVQVQLNGPEPEPTAGGPAWAARDVVRQAARSLLNTGRRLASMAIWIAIYAPIWLLLWLVIWLIRRRGRGKPQATSAP